LPEINFLKETQIFVNVKKSLNIDTLLGILCIEGYYFNLCQSCYSEILLELSKTIPRRQFYVLLIKM